MQTRRTFIGGVATGLAGSLLGANDRIRVGVIGAGERGMQLAREAAACPNTELAGFADVYTRRLDDARKLSTGAKSVQDYRHLLDDKSINSVLIATPQHLHGECFIAALDAGKHVYLEKTMAFTVDEAKLMRTAYLNAGKRTVQIGHQSLSSGQVPDAVNYLASGGVGKVTNIRAHMYRNTPHGKPQWAKPVFPDMTPENIVWDSFHNGAEFSADRFANWRYYWDYSGGNVHENMCHQVAFWHKTMGLGIPSRVNMSGGLYLWKDGREVPDTMSVAMEYDEELLFTWDSGFGNNSPGVTEEVLGTDGSIVRGQQIRFFPQKVNRPDLSELMGQTVTKPRAHMQDFFDCIRTGKEPNAGFDIGFQVSIVCRMAVESYRQARQVTWDPVNEQIV